MGAMLKSWKRNTEICKNHGFSTWPEGLWALWAVCQTRWNSQKPQFQNRLLALCALCAHVDIDALDTFGLFTGEGVRGRAGKVIICISKVNPLLRRSYCCIFWLTNRHPDSTCVVEITAANFAAFLCFDLPTRLLISASKFPNSCGYSQISTQNKFRCSWPVGTIVWRACRKLCFSAIYSSMSLVYCCWRAALPGEGGIVLAHWCAD